MTELPRKRRTQPTRRSSKPTGAFKPHKIVNDDGTPVNVHLYVLLDRSGSMASIADDVIGGFNQLLAQQQADGPDALLTLVQFDSTDPQEILADASPVHDVLPLDASTFLPRGATPLLDATGQLIARAANRAASLDADGEPTEEVVFISITDGHENASTELSLPAVKELIAKHRAAGFTFVFLSAALDVYGEASGLGHGVGAVQSFEPDATGTRLAFDSLSARMTERRQRIRDGETFDREEFFEGDKPAEADRLRRRGS